MSIPYCMAALSPTRGNFSENGHKNDTSCKNASLSAAESDFNKIVQMFKKDLLKNGSTFRFDKSSFVAEDLETTRYLSKQEFLQVFEESIIYKIATLEDEEESVKDTIDEIDITITLIEETARKLKAEAGRTIRNSIYLAANSELYSDLSDTIEQINENSSIIYRIQNFGMLQRKNDKTYLVIDKGKIAAPEGPVSLLDNTSDIISNIKEKALLRQQLIVTKLNEYYQLWSNVVSKVEGDNELNLNDMECLL